jgi:hypothetical protein
VTIETSVPDCCVFHPLPDKALNGQSAQIVEPAGSCGHTAAVLFETVTTTAADVVVFPAASRATAVIVWLPFATVVVSHETLNGVPRSSAPILTPSRLNWTPTTPTLSVAFADTVIVPETVAPFTGAVTEIVGGVISTVNVVTVKSPDIARFPDPSRDRTRK